MEKYLRGRECPVGVFDSGVGGLTVAREIMRQLPGESLVYFGDTARLPYGSKSRENVIKFSRQIIHFLKTKEVKAIVIACNTATSLALEVMQKETDIPVIGVVEPGARAAVNATRNKHVGVIGTEATIRSHMYSQVMQGMEKDIQVVSKACPLFVPLVEEGFAKHKVTDEIIDYYLSSMKASAIDSLILGCTHYPLLRSKIHAYMGDGVEIVNPAYETALDLKSLLLERGLLREASKEEKPSYSFYVSDASEKFREFADSIMPCVIDTTEEISIEEY